MSPRYAFSIFGRVLGLTTVNLQIPKSPTGKVLRRVLQDAHEQKKKSKTAAKKSKL